MSDIDRQNKKLEKFLLKYYSGFYNNIYIKNNIMYFENKDKRRKNCLNVSYLTTTEISSRFVS
jgi:hypothetical protein